MYPIRPDISSAIGRIFSLSIKNKKLIIMWQNGNQQRRINETVPFMNTLASCINKVVQDGYTHSFNVTKEGLYSNQSNKYYQPEEVTVINFYRFEGQSNPDDNAILYILQTSDGSKGTLVDAYGAYSDEDVATFIKEVNTIKKIVDKPAA